MLYVAFDLNTIGSRSLPSDSDLLSGRRVDCHTVRCDGSRNIHHGVRRVGNDTQRIITGPALDEVISRLRWRSFESAGNLSWRAVRSDRKVMEPSLERLGETLFLEASVSMFTGSEVRRRTPQSLGTVKRR